MSAADTSTFKFIDKFLYIVHLKYFYPILMASLCLTSSLPSLTAVQIEPNLSHHLLSRLMNCKAISCITSIYHMEDFLLRFALVFPTRFGSCSRINASLLNELMHGFCSIFISLITSASTKCKEKLEFYLFRFLQLNGE